MKSTAARLVCLIVLLTFLYDANCLARSEGMDGNAVRKAIAVLQKAGVVYRFCGPCGDKIARKVIVSRVGYAGAGSKYVLSINDETIDPATTYVRQGDTWQNLAVMLGLPAEGAPGELGSQWIQEDIDAMKAVEPSGIPYLSRIEKEIVDEYNLARTNPGEYARFIEETRPYYHGRYMDIPGQIRVVTREGSTAVNEAVRFLYRQKPLPPLTPSKGMSTAAKDLMTDSGPRGLIGHKGSDGSLPADRLNRHGRWKGTCGENISYGPRTAREIVMQLIIDDGVASRGHRGNIFDPEYRRIGVAYGPHKRFEIMSVQTFAKGYEDVKE
jgi:uncharacterized protein YkwD